MPKVPVSGGPQVQEAALPDITDRRQLSADVLGGGESAQRLGQAVVSTVGEFNDFFAEQKKIADDTAVLDADNQIAVAQNEILGKTKEMRGKNAAGANEFATGEWDSRVDEIRGTLKNDDQRVAFDNAVAQRKVQLDRNVMNHSSGELQKYHNEVYKSAKDLAANDAVTNWDDPDVVIGAVNRQKTLIKDFAQKNGKSQEWIEQQTLAATSNTHTGVINAMLDAEQHRDAKKYFADNKKEISAQDQDDIRDALETSGLLGRSQENTDDIMSKGLNQTKSIELARKIKDPNERSETVKMIKERFSEKKAAQDEAEEKFYEGVMNEIELTKKRPKQSVWMKLTPSQRTTADARIDKLNKNDDTTNYAVYTDLKTMASNPATQSLFLKEKLLEKRDKLSDKHYEELLNLQIGLRQKDPAVTGETRSIRTAKQVVDGALLQMGLNPNEKKSKKDIRKINSFRRQVDEAIEDMLADTGKKKASSEDVQKIVDALTFEVAKDGWFSESTRFFEVREEGGDVFVSDIQTINDVPENEQKEIESSLRRSGKLPQNEAEKEAKIIEIYQQKIIQVRSAFQ